VDETIGFLWECTPLAFAGEKTTFILEGLFRIGIPLRSHNPMSYYMLIRTLRKK